ncbi:uncharacterized protein [Atheta coriaria]|uniref:uncharacterized protein n=1 Tax=Dalotia coriaria TaxID=877792 RepID=UPI0031F3AF39
MSDLELSNLFQSLDISRTLENLIQIDNIDSGLDSGNQVSENSNCFKMPNEFKPEYLKCVPEFNGDTNDLVEFLSCAESIVNTFVDANDPGNFINIFILKSILNKLTGNARIAVNISGVQTFNELKETLIRNFSDQRDEVCLIRDMVLLKQTNETALQYYDKVISIQNLLSSYLNAHESNDIAIRVKRELYNKLALKTFMAGLKEPLGSSIRAMRPDSMQIALQYINEERNVRYYQKDTIKTNTNANFQKANPPPGNFNRFNTNENYKRPFQPQNKVVNTRPFNEQAKPSFSKDTNVFKPNPNYKPNPETPMSTSTRQSVPYANFSKPKQGFYRTQQYHNIESENLDSSLESMFREEPLPDEGNPEQNSYDEINFEQNTVNFQVLASETQE